MTGNAAQFHGLWMSEVYTSHNEIIISKILTPSDSVCNYAAERHGECKSASGQPWRGDAAVKGAAKEGRAIAPK
ncbi:MAG: hypothetical protein K8F58_03115, partial [Bauldia sp.]|nr:hypothetical protein [Bauldia sp.]